LQIVEPKNTEQWAVENNTIETQTIEYKHAIELPSFPITYATFDAL